MRASDLITLPLAALLPAYISKASRSNLPAEYFVLESALHYMLDKHSSYGNERFFTTAYLLTVGEFTDELVESFRGYSIPVEKCLLPKSCDLDTYSQATGRHLVLWTAAVRENDGNRARVSVTWYRGKMAAGVHTVWLQNSAEPPALNPQMKNNPEFHRGILGIRGKRSRRPQSASAYSEYSAVATGEFAVGGLERNRITKPVQARARDRSGSISRLAGGALPDLCR